MINNNIERNEVEQSVARNSLLSQQDAERAADVIIQEYEQIEQQLHRLEKRAEYTAQQVAEASSRAAIWSFVALLLGVITAALGGYLGKSKVESVHDATLTHES